MIGGMRMFDKYDNKRFASFRKLLGKGDSKKTISVNFRADMIERLDELAKKASMISGNNITRNAIIEEGVAIYVEEFEEYINSLYENYTDSNKYIDDGMKLPDKSINPKMIESKKIK